MVTWLTIWFAHHLADHNRNVLACYTAVSYCMWLRLQSTSAGGPFYSHVLASFPPSWF